MYRLILVTALLSVAASTTVDPRKAKHYRSDYEYNPKTDAFYKFHTESVNYIDARAACEEEGGSLMSPSPRDLVQAHGMLKQFPDLADEAWIASDGEEDSSEYATQPTAIEIFSPAVTEQIPTMTQKCQAVTRTGFVQNLLCLTARPFFCKVQAKDAPYDSYCDVHSKGYKYYESVGSCYKFSHVAYSWDQAYDECEAEGSHLVILNSELEHRLIHNLTQSAPRVAAAQTDWSWYAGIRAKKPVDGSPVVFKTIFGDTLDEAGYAGWSENEPNNAGNDEYCGSIFKNDGKYNDLKCSHRYAFICENEISNKVHSH